MTDQKVQKGATIFECKLCDYKCYKQFFINRHNQTKKHQILTNTDQKVQKGAEFSCVCGKNYKHKQSLFTHKNICQTINGKQYVELKIEENEVKKEATNQGK
jgi:hypothetical protein